MARRSPKVPRRTLGDMLQVLTMVNPAFVYAVTVGARREIERIERCQRLRSQRRKRNH